MLQSSDISLATASSLSLKRRLPVGAEPQPGGGVHFRVWAPEHRRLEVVVDRKEDGKTMPMVLELEREEGGYFSAYFPQIAAGDEYRFRVNGQERLLADPVSRFQPQGPHGPSQVVDPDAFAWSDSPWEGLVLEGQVLYEMHVGTFTPEGTWEAAARELPALAEMGITAIEVMPVADFAGRFGWGYDGVNLFAPTRLYGRPDDFHRFVDLAHGLGIGVILDVVYNHMGPRGNVLPAFSRHYFTNRYQTDWGEPINYDGEHAGPVREFILANAGYWIDEFHLDGLRLDATQSMFDASQDHILAAICRHARRVAGKRKVLLVAENEPQQIQTLRSQEEGGFGFDALWNDDFHHSAIVALSGRNDAYYSQHLGAPQEFVSAAKRGFLYQGQWYAWQKQPRGTPTSGARPQAFVHFLDNHDQVANSIRGSRVHQITDPGRYRAMTAVLLLLPGTPMLFQGQEFAASSPFLYFADHQEELGLNVQNGRGEFLSQFATLATPEAQAVLPDPTDPATFERSKLNPLERIAHREAAALHRDLLRLRREDPVFRRQRSGAVDGAVLGNEAFVVRFFGDAEDRLLLVNLGLDLQLIAAPEPLLAPPAGTWWQTLWSSEDPRYGGRGTPAVYTRGAWRLPGHAAVALQPQAMEEAS